jgi:hypothetical protein
MYESTSDYNALGHINQEMWIQTPNGGYVEEGLLNGKQPNGNPYNNVAYQQFWASTTDQGYQYDHWIANLSPDGHNHVYEIVNRGGTNLWDIYLDYGSPRGTSTAESSGVGNYEPIGIELAQGGGHPDIDPSSHADNFDNYWQVLQGGRWIYPVVSGYVDHGCSNHPLGYCLNGQIYGNGEWSDNKP